MSFPDPIFRKRKRNEKPNIKADDIMKDTLLTVLTTSRGWIIRQAIKATAYITVPLTVWLEGQGAEGEQTKAITSGIVAAVAVLAELGFSFLARKNP
jgi:hypothetical protein